MSLQVNYNDVLSYWRKDLPDTIEKLDNKLDSFRVLFAYNSNRIENENITYHDTREIFENGKLINYTGDTRTIFEIQNQKECYHRLLPLIIKKEPVSIELAKLIHKELTKGTYDERRFALGERAGEFKKHDYVTGINEVGTPPEYVEEDLKELFNDINNAASSPNYNGLIVGAYLHASFEFIHPFADGNGRVGRTLLNYYLLANDYPPLIVYDEDKNSYYSALEQYDTTEKLDKLISFLQEQTIKTWEKAISRSNHISAPPRTRGR